MCIRDRFRVIIHTEVSAFTGNFVPVAFQMHKLAVAQYNFATGIGLYKLILLQTMYPEKFTLYADSDPFADIETCMQEATFIPTELSEFERLGKMLTEAYKETLEQKKDENLCDNLEEGHQYICRNMLKGVLEYGVVQASLSIIGEIKRAVDVLEKSAGSGINGEELYQKFKASGDQYFLSAYLVIEGVINELMGNMIDNLSLVASEEGNKIMLIIFSFIAFAVCVMLIVFFSVLMKLRRRIQETKSALLLIPVDVLVTDARIKTIVTRLQVHWTLLSLLYRMLNIIQSHSPYLFSCSTNLRLFMFLWILFVVNFLTQSFSL
eukprot:TRINITY_DN5466_c0_g1_i2.p1 TRINITY_DN5466_c0_g1~~TRINITY_DN5466_c0_g1_i2.p1  ORF type:complete len:342 (-),score=54.92 TRINITY_DN5466_c0_g1_i2:108-1073(-)